MARRLSLILNLLIITVLVYSAVDTFYRVADTYVVFEPEAVVESKNAPHVRQKKDRSLAQYNASVVKRDIFHTVKPVEDESVKEDIKDLEITKLKVTLMGTFVGAPEFSFAVIRDKVKKIQDLYGIGEKVAGAVVKQIKPGEVVLSINGRREVLLMEDDKKARSGSSSKKKRKSRGGKDFKVGRGEINRAIGNINQLMTQVSVRPHFENGKPAGLMLKRIKAGSIFKRMGLEDGDVIKGVNDEEITDTEDVLSLYRTMKDSEAVALQIKRKGELTSINYEFE